MRTIEPSTQPSSTNRRNRLAGGVAVAVAAGLLASLTTASPAAAAWENCGDYICTTYYSRSETRAIAEYMSNVGPYAAAATSGFCGALGAVFGSRYGNAGAATGGVAGGGICSELGRRYDWRSTLDQAVGNNACFQVEYSNQWWGRIVPNPGTTNHPEYCAD